MEYCHTSGVSPELCDRIESGAVIDALIPRRHDYDARGSDPILQHPILRHGRPGRRHHGILAEPESRRVINVDVTIASMRRSFQLRMTYPHRIRHFLGFAWQYGDRRDRAPYKAAACNHAGLQNGCLPLQLIIVGKYS